MKQTRLKVINCTRSLTIEVKVDLELLMQVEAALRGYGWTAEEACQGLQTRK
ncbi:MAG: hypothetical protein PUC61_09940 [Bacteroidales bacterium]|nr:hypothetical protein [Bacteroidales bacterium]